MTGRCTPTKLALVLCKKVHKKYSGSEYKQPNAAAIADQCAEAADWHFRVKRKKRFRSSSSSTRAWLLGRVDMGASFVMLFARTLTYSGMSS
jgi:hypothetical protein